MADAGDQCQRHRVGDVAAGDASDRKLGIEDEECRCSKRTGADRRDRNEHPEHGSEEDGPELQAARFHRIDMVAGPTQDPRPEEDSDAGDQERAAKQHVEHECALCAAYAEIGHHAKRDDCSWDAPGGECADDAPVDRLALVVNSSPDGFRHRCIEEVGADGGRGMEAEEKNEQRGHERAATDTGQADERANQKAGDRIEWIVGRKDRCPLTYVVIRHGIAALLAPDGGRCFA